MKKINLKKEAEIIRRLHYLLGSGQGIVESFIILEKSYPVLSLITHSLQSGKSLSKSIKLSKIGLSPLTIKIIEVGELTGTLSRTFLTLSIHLRHNYELRSQIINICIYPVLVCLLSGSMLLFLLTYIFPKVLPIFDSLKIKLPYTTHLILFMSTLFLNHIFVIISTIFIIGVLFIFLLKNILFYLPFTKNIMSLKFQISFFRSLGVMLQSQVGIIQALFILFDNEDSKYFKSKLKNLIQHVETGRSLSSFFAELPKVFNVLSPHFIGVGEKTGSLSKSCLYFSEYLEHDFMAKIKRGIQFLEPTIMIFVGFVVAFVSLSLISPIYELSSISAF